MQLVIFIASKFDFILLSGLWTACVDSNRWHWLFAGASPGLGDVCVSDLLGADCLPSSTAPDQCSHKDPPCPMVNSGEWIKLTTTKTKALCCCRSEKRSLVFRNCISPGKHVAFSYFGWNNALNPTNFYRACASIAVPLFYTWQQEWLMLHLCHMPLRGAITTTAGLLPR